MNQLEQYLQRISHSILRKPLLWLLASVVTGLAILETARSGNGRYELVAVDKALRMYLLDTKTGRVWRAWFGPDGKFVEVDR